MPADLPQDDHLLDAARDVAHGFAAYGRYGRSTKKALKALQRRAPGFAAEQYERVFELFVELYDLAREAVDRHVLERPDKRSKFAEFADIDYEACLSEMEQLRPGYAHREKAIILSWSILYYYLM